MFFVFYGVVFGGYVPSGRGSKYNVVAVCETAKKPAGYYQFAPKYFATRASSGPRTQTSAACMFGATKLNSFVPNEIVYAESDGFVISITMGDK